MTSYEKLVEIVEEQDPFFVDMMVSGEFKIGLQTATDILYIKNKHWFKPEMVDELINIDHEGRFDHVFYPNVYNESEFGWDNVNKKFIPPASAEARQHVCDNFIDIGVQNVKFILPGGEIEAKFGKHLCLHPHDLTCPNDGTCNPKMHIHQVAIDEGFPTIFTTVDSVSEEGFENFISGKAPFSVSWDAFWEFMGQV